MDNYKLYKINRKNYYSLCIYQTAGNGWNCNMCTFTNNNQSSYCEMCGAHNLEETKQQKTWNCSICTFENNYQMRHCEMCGTPKSPDKTFYVYTLGIMEWLDMDKTPTMWNTYIRENVLNIIPPSYNKIIINHYDPLSDETDYKEETSFITTADMRKSTSGREIESNFYRDIIKASHIRDPHIILDFSHETLEIDSNTNKPKLKDIDKDVKAMYIGYIGAKNLDNNGYTQHYLMSHKLFTVSDDGIVKTYIDRLIDNKYNKTDYLENNTIKNIHKLIIDEIKVKIGIPKKAPPYILDNLEAQTKRREYLDKLDSFKNSAQEGIFEKINENIIEYIVNGIMSEPFTPIQTIINTASDIYARQFLPLMNVPDPTQ